LVVLPFAIGMLTLEEARKAIVRSRPVPSPSYINGVVGG
jgi:hypothetical protein